ncbi:hypothetical protein FPV67DRAFT_1664025 [Lyophyllum atratum]|nr:hypothetical protein FPV67DRAFT_1664025 [Lyophyllum atratum]
MRNPKTRSKDSPKLGTALDSSEVVLSTLTEAAEWTSLPYLQEVAGAALSLVNIVQDVKSNKEAFKRLANDACALVYIILSRYKDENSNSKAAAMPAHVTHVKDLARTLDEIYRYARSQGSKNKLVKIIQHKSDAGAIHEYRERLRQSLDVFNVKSSISIQDTLSSIQEKITRMNRERPVLTSPKQRPPQAVAHESEQNRVAESVVTKSDSTRGLHGEVRSKGVVPMSTSNVPHLPQSPSPGHGVVPYGVYPSRPQSMYPGQQLSLPSNLPAMSPFHANQPGYYALQGGSKRSIGGDQNTYSGSVINTNSGNVSTHMVSNSNNDSSVRIGNGTRRHR